MRRHFLAAAIALAAAAPAGAQGLADTPINENTLIFCKEGPGEPQLSTYSNLGGVMRRYEARFHFAMSVRPGKPLTLMFSNDESPYFISYDAAPYRDSAGRTGIELKSMHLFLDNADRDIQGPPMCYFTEFGK